MKLCSPGTRARLGALGVGRVRKLRAVEGNLGHSLQYWRGRVEGRERKGGLAIPCARATRGRGLPSLDAPTLGTRQATSEKVE